MSLIDAAMQYNQPRYEEHPNHVGSIVLGPQIGPGRVPPGTIDGTLPTELNVETKLKLKEATKYDAGKTDWTILPLGALEEVSKVLTFGAQKYSRGNFASNGGLEYTRVINSLLRHVTAFARGEDNDPETGLSHMAHAGCNVLFLLHYELNKDKFSTVDDRATKILN